MFQLVPRGAVTGIGSLPHRDAQAAVRFIADHSPEIPFWPQLPQRSPDENMIAQVLAPVMDLLTPRGVAQFEIPNGKIGEFRARLRECDAELSPSSAAGFFAFEQALQAGAFADAQMLKGQLTGPITLSNCLWYKGRPLSQLREAQIELTAYLCRLGKWQSARLEQFDKPVLIFVDEPALGADVLIGEGILPLQCVVQALREAGAWVGIHCCASDTPTALCAARPDLISFDAHLNLETFLTAPEILEYVRAGGCLGFGLVPTFDDVSEWSSFFAFMRLLQAADSATIEALVTQSVITATCGLGLMDEPGAALSFRRAQELSGFMRKASAPEQHRARRSPYASPCTIPVYKN